MRVDLGSPLRQGLLAAVGVVLLAFYFNSVTRHFVASRLSNLADRSSLEAAAHLEPSNARHWHRLGKYLFFVSSDTSAAIQSYRTATALNPHAARYWLDLALAQQVAGDAQAQRLALEQAIRAEPTTPEVAWEAANFFLIQGDVPTALRQFRIVLERDPKATPLALELCWRATRSAEVVLDQALPATLEAHVAFLDFLVGKQEDAAADLVWARLLRLASPPSPEGAFPYLQHLLEAGKGDQARKAWEDLAQVSPKLRAYLPAQNLIVNGNFEQDILGGGLDWHYQPQPHVSVAVDTAEFYSGSRALAVAFDGQGAGEAGIRQWIPVRPSTRYEFRVFVKSVGIESASGPRLSLRGTQDGTAYVLTRDFLGSQLWRMEQAEFTTGPDTRLLQLKLVRIPEQSLIKGQLWIDELSLTEK